MNGSVSQALNDNRVSDMEFQLITREMQKYRQLKETLHKNKQIHASQILKRSKIKLGRNLEKNWQRPAQI